MADKFQNKYRIASARLQTWNYGWYAAYFVTICTKGREHYFGEVIIGQVQLSPIGKLAHKFWTEIPKHFPFVILDAFVIMPNHLHGILVFDKRNDGVVETRHCLVSTTPDDDATTRPDDFPKTIG